MKKCWKKILVALVICMMLVGTIGTAAFAQDYIWNPATGKYNKPVKPGWNRVDTSYGETYWYYGDSNGNLVQGWKKIDGKWYAFFPGKNGQSEPGLWIVHNTGMGTDTPSSMYRNGTFPLYDTGTERPSQAKIYSFDSSGAMRYGWVKAKVWDNTTEHWYYHGSNGAAVTGWQYINGKWYYFLPTYVINENYENGIPVMRGGYMQTGWLKDGGKWYYLDSSGAMCTGWIKVSGKWYFADSTGALCYGWKSVGDKWYCFDSNGVMRTGWYCDGGKWYYLGSDGAMCIGWVNVSGKWYCMNSSGVMLTGWQKIGTKWYCFDSNGAMRTGWYCDGGTWYYFSTDEAMCTGWLQIGGTWYFFKSSGAMACNEWHDGCWVGSDGAWTYQYKGFWRLDSKGWRYCDGSGWYAKGQTIIIDGVPYTFDSNGYLIEGESGWVKASEVPAGAIITDQKWEYTLTSYTSSSSSSLAGWEWYRTDTSWSSYGNWSDWSTTAVSSSDSRQVETRNQEICTLQGICCGDSSGNRCYLAYMQSGYTLRLDYGQRTVTRSELNSWQTIAQGGVYDYAANVYGYIVGPGTAYIHPTENVPFFFASSRTEKQYRYRDRSPIYTYRFRKIEIKTSTSDPTGQSGVSNVVKYVKYKMK